ncbi:hypothetical protein BJ508DRAFT_310269 [Ascobolus immersus RN42]|uniref:Uncharacterized protein n=1 Tax=Ascobolus immersus RN42 TaxID=1160509 RepID=A0A3N4HW34_ASCIM|nr:hypothetical protein BJ508DRAFT_310269 [Ascobolus immersus RN42]
MSASGKYSAQSNAKKPQAPYSTKYRLRRGPVYHYVVANRMMSRSDEATWVSLRPGIEVQCSYQPTRHGPVGGLCDGKCLIKGGWDEDGYYDPNINCSVAGCVGPDRSASSSNTQEWQRDKEEHIRLHFSNAPSMECFPHHSGVLNNSTDSSFSSRKRMLNNSIDPSFSSEYLSDISGLHQGLQTNAIDEPIILLEHNLSYIGSWIQEQEEPPQWIHGPRTASKPSALFLDLTWNSLSSR